MKLKFNENRYLPTLGVHVQAGDEVDVPDDPFAPSETRAAIVSPKKSNKSEGVVNSDGDSAQ